MIVGDDKRSLFFFFFFFKLSNVSKRLSELHTSGAFSTQNVGAILGPTYSVNVGAKTWGVCKEQFYWRLAEYARKSSTCGAAIPVVYGTLEA